jgi:hypothetical protein
MLGNDVVELIECLDGRHVARPETIGDTLQRAHMCLVPGRLGR